MAKTTKHSNGIKTHHYNVFICVDLQQNNDVAAMANDYGFHTNNVNSSFDYPGWIVPPPGNYAGTSSLGSVRRGQPHPGTGTGR